MRLHHLSVTAFGPFADTVEVDLDDLAADGLFLLSGPTGAGKSSVLDAVCFALYGQVPGDRQTARHLRSDLAAPDVAPRVVLELTLGERRLRFTRSPSWERAKRRGTGTTTPPATVLVEERSDEGWTHLTGRMDEAGQLVQRMVGLTPAQFCQVVLLPQGAFQQFLRADAGDRQRLLQSIFRTRRYADVERWLIDRRRATRADSLAGLAVVGDVVSRLSEAAGESAPEVRLDAPSGDPVLVDPGPTGVRAWALDRAATARDAAADAGQVLADAEATLREAAARLEQERARQVLRTRGERARHALAALADRTEEVERDRERLDAARRAAPAAGHVAARERSAAALDAAVRAWRRAVLALGPAAHEATGALALGLDEPPADLDLALAEAALRDLAARRHRCADAQGLARDLEGIRARAQERERALVVVRRDLERCEEEAAALPERVAAARTRVDAARAAGEALPRARADLAALDARLAAARSAALLADDLAEAEAAHEASRLRVVTAKEEWLEIAEARVSGMAAELAHQLAVGGACPVCGSCDHPAPAPTSPHAPDAAREKRARGRVDDAEIDLAARADRLRTLREQHARDDALAEQRGEGHWAAAVAAARTEVQALTQRADDVDAARERLEQLERRHEGAAAEVARLAAEVAALEARGAAEAEQEHDLSVRVRRVLAAEGAPTLPAALQALDELTRRWNDAVAAIRERTACEGALEEAARAADEAAHAAGFDDADAAAAAHVPPAELTALEAALRAHDERTAEARAVLDDPEVAAALEADPPEVEPAASALRMAEEAREAARARAVLGDRRAERLAHLASALGDALDAWAPLREAHDVADRVASLAAGKGENRQGLALPAYVVAWRLGQVVAAANERLAPMTAARYALAQRGGGLDLDVRDDWSGELRDPATLSGGETFLVSLSLALGLADVVLAESAADAEGSDLETLFVDEGFGSLDADTLDDVMDVLDDLRDGGRVVGVVSHVAELRTRITTQLHVRPGRSGSTVRVVHADA